MLIGKQNSASLFKHQRKPPPHKQHTNSPPTPTVEENHPHSTIINRYHCHLPKLQLILATSHHPHQS
jgi:hypothetical protein